MTWIWDQNQATNSDIFFSWSDIFFEDQKVYSCKIEKWSDMHENYRLLEDKKRSSNPYILDLYLLQQPSYSRLKF